MGVGSPILGGGCFSKFLGGLQIFGGVPPNFRRVSTGIRSTFGRYASYWNAFLLINLYLQRWTAIFKRLHFLAPNDAIEWNNRKESEACKWNPYEVYFLLPRIV